jgi:hypothetical protein
VGTRHWPGRVIALPHGWAGWLAASNRSALPPSVKQLIIAKSSRVETPRNSTSPFLFYYVSILFPPAHITPFASDPMIALVGNNAGNLPVFFTCCYAFHRFSLSPPPSNPIKVRGGNGNYSNWDIFPHLSALSCVPPSPSASSRESRLEGGGGREAYICKSTGGVHAKVQTGTLWKKNVGAWPGNGIPCEQSIPVNSNSTSSNVPIPLGVAVYSM